MAQIHRSAATFRIVGDDLLPHEITRVLGASPTHSLAKGEEIVGKKSGQVRFAKSGSWRLEAEDCFPENIDAQIQSIFGQLTNDLSVWKTLSERYKLDLFCGVFMRYSNEGMEISSESLSILGARGIKIDLDIYGPIEGGE